MKHTIKTVIGLLLSSMFAFPTFGQNEMEDLNKSIEQTINKALQQAQVEIEAAQKEIAESRKELQKQIESTDSEEEKEALEKEAKELKKAEKALMESSLALQNEEGSSTKIKIGKSKITIGSDGEENSSDTSKCIDAVESNKFWSGIELGVSGYLTPANSLGTPNSHSYLELDYSKSLHLSINFWEQDFNIIKEYVKLSTGMGVQFNSYAFKRDFILDPTGEEVSANTELTSNFKKNKLNSTWVNVPLILGFSTNQNREKAFHFSVGAVGGYKITNANKRKYEIDGQKYKAKVKSDYNTLPYWYGARASIGIGSFQLYGTYSLSSLFEENQGPELYPFTAGVRLLMF